MPPTSTASSFLSISANNEQTGSLDIQPFTSLENVYHPENTCNLPSYSTRSIETLEELEQEQAPHENIADDMSDPATYANKKLTSQQINFALKLESQKLEETSCRVTKGRKFLPSWKVCHLPDGTKKERKWLIYSRTKDVAFCLHCMIFASPKSQTVWSTMGYKNWVDRNALRDIELHESSKSHLECQVSRIQWLAGNRVDSSLIRKNNEVVKHHREVLSVIIDCCKYLSEEMLAFRKNDCMTGKLMKLFRLLAKHSPDARVYCEKLDKARHKNKQVGSNLLSHYNIFDLIGIMSKLVVSRIADSISSSGCYSIIVDSTYDASKKETTAILARYVQHSYDGYGNTLAKPQEHLLSVFTSGDTTGENLSRHVMNALKDLNIDPKNMIGQSMDGAGNMSGRCMGMKTFVQKESPTAMYVWCYSHRFALVVEKSFDTCIQMKNMFSLLQELYVFFSGHRRQHKLTENLEKSEVKDDRKKRLKRVNTTRWTSKNDSLKTVLSCYNVIKQTLEELCLDKSSDSDTIVASKSLLKHLSDYEVVAAMIIASDLFKVLNPVTVCLQGKSVDYAIVNSVISETKERVNILRSDESWEKLHFKIEDFATSHEVSPIKAKRLRLKKRFMDELSIDEALSDPLKKIKVEVFFKTLDSLTIHLKDRFPDKTMAIITEMAFFSHECLERMAETIQPQKIWNLCSFYNLDNQEVAAELETFSFVYKSSHSSIDISDLLPKPKDMPVVKQNQQDSLAEETDDNEGEGGAEKEGAGTDKTTLELWLRRGFIKPYRCLLQLSGFPNLNRLYKILLSLSVTSCSAERTMSRIKIVKNRLRTSMSDTWLKSLLILCSESEVLSKIPHEEIIDKFAFSTKQRQQILLNT